MRIQSEGFVQSTVHGMVIDIISHMQEQLSNLATLATLTVKNKHQQTAADVAPHDTHAEVKKYLENAALSALVVSVECSSSNCSFFLNWSLWPN